MKEKWCQSLYWEIYGQQTPALEIKRPVPPDLGNAQTYVGDSQNHKPRRPVRGPVEQVVQELLRFRD